jgi:eukaryotic-like serine/threonine-protein kinase
MGYVLAAHHLKLDQRVALKFLKPEALKHAHIVQRFAREARAAAKIRGEHVARVIDVGDLPNGAPYIVMEYLEGEDLGQRLEQRGALPVEEAVSYVLQACEALAEAHAAGIVHRDLKPPNLFLARTAGRMATLKVLDFGISKALDETTEGGRNLTSTSMIMGTPHYMSPEQLRSSRDVDQRSDIWALGVVLFELLTGQPPFDGENATAVITSIVTDAPRSLFELCPDAPPGLAPVLLRCLAKSRAERFPNVLELARALLPFCGDRARESLLRIESIVRPIHSQAPPPDTEVSATVMPSTKFDPVVSAPGAITSVDVSVPMASAGGGASNTRSPATQPTVRSAEVAGHAPAETRANWDATLPAAEVAASKPRRSGAVLSVAGLVALIAVGYAATLLQRRSSDSAAMAAGAPGAPSAVAAATASPVANATTSSNSVGSPATATSESTVSPSAPLPEPPVTPRGADSASKSERVEAAPAAVSVKAVATGGGSPRPTKPGKKPEPQPREVTDKPVSNPAPTTTGGGSLRMGIK